MKPTKKDTRRTPRQADAGPHYKHDLGQHFLYDEALLNDLTDRCELTNNDAVLEIGPGAGTLTACLCERAGKVVAVEVDRDVLPFLRLKTEAFTNLQIVEADIRKVPKQQLTEWLGGPFSVVANIPYNITAPIFDLLLDAGLPIRRIAVMVQKEVADKLFASPGEEGYGLLSVRCQYACTYRFSEVVTADRFTPPPKVDSAFICMDRRDAPPMPAADEKLLWRMVNTAFCYRRKTLMNALKGVVPSETLAAAIEKMNKPATLRGETLTVEEWIRLSNLCSGKEEMP